MPDTSRPLMAEITRTVTLLTILTLGTSGICNSAAASTEARQAIAIGKQNACFACHSIEQTVVGPGYQAISQRYRDVPGAQQQLHTKVRQGGSGNWGQVAMPANTQISDADLEK